MCENRTRSCKKTLVIFPVDSGNHFLRGFQVYPDVRLENCISGLQPVRSVQKPVGRISAVYGSVSKNSFLPVLRNTIVISLLKLILGFPIPVILALMMNEMKNMAFKKVSQTLLYLPHFISWVILSGIIMTLLDPDNGMITNLIQTLTRQHIMVLTDSRYFVPMLIITDIYKGLGWGTIIYFAAISGIDPSLYEAAAIDGAGKWKQAINITLPCIVPTIIIQFILSSSNILNAGFDQIFMLYTSHVYDVADIIDTYVYRMGIINNDYSFSTAAGMFKSVVALIMILFVNQVAKRTGNEGLF